MKRSGCGTLPASLSILDQVLTDNTIKLQFLTDNHLSVHSFRHTVILNEVVEMTAARWSENEIVLCCAPSYYSHFNGTEHQDQSQSSRKNYDTNKKEQKASD